MAGDSEKCVPLLKALADESRWRIVRVLIGESMSVGELGARLEMSQYNVSKHVRILREAGIVTTKRSGKQVICDVADTVRARIAEDQSQLDLGCCRFQFD